MSQSLGQIVDELLVMRCQDGEAEAMEQLVARWQRPLWRYAYRLTGQEDAAWEAMQESWLAIVRGLGRLEDPSLFRRWAYRIVTHKASDWVRARRRQRDRRRSLDDQTAADPRGPSDDARHAKELLRRLPPGQRAVLSLRYLEGFTTGEVAEILGIPEGTARSRLHYARNELRRLAEGDSP